MAITRTVSNEFKFESGKASVNLSSDTFKIVLMASGFTFDPDTHGDYADISASEITSAGGYTVGGESITVDDAWAQDNTGNRGRITWADKTLTASGAAFDTFCAVCIIDVTASNLVIGCIELGQDIDIPDGSSFQLQDMAYNKA